VSAILASAQAPPPKPATTPKTSLAAPAVKPPAAAISDDTVVLSIGDEKITKAQFDLIVSALPPQQQAQLQAPGGKRKLAESLAELRALAQEGRAHKLDQTPKAQSQIRVATDQVIAQAMYQELTASAKPIDAAAIQAYYDAHKQEWDEVKAKHILIRYQGSQVPLKAGGKELTDAEALAKAKEIRAKIIAGAKFDDLAKAESDDTGNAAQGGDLGSFTKGRMVPAFEQAAFAAKIGEVTEPVKTQFGYHLILVESHSVKTLDEASPEIETKLKPQLAQQAAQAALTDLKAKKNITYDDAYFGK
jgi:peptidyl-prolyl cis-trans isomerase C